MIGHFAKTSPRASKIGLQHPDHPHSQPGTHTPAESASKTAWGIDAGEVVLAQELLQARLAAFGSQASLGLLGWWTSVAEPKRLDPVGTYPEHMLIIVIIYDIYNI